MSYWCYKLDTKVHFGLLFTEYRLDYSLDYRLDYSLEYYRIIALNIKYKLDFARRLLV